LIVSFGDLSYFYVLGLLMVPAIGLGLTGRRIKWYGIVANAIIVVALVADSRRQALLLAAFLVGETALMKAHLWFVARYGRDRAAERRLVVLLVLLPLIVIKLSGLVQFSSIAFIGVSYFTFRAVQVVIEISDGLIERLGIVDFLYFMTFFPTIASGPIDRSRRFLQDADAPIDGRQYSQLLGRGLWLVLLGATYKFVFAAWIVTLLPQTGRDPLGMIAYMYLYGFDLFFDFAGYSAMAVGAAYIFGVRTPMNFRMPFVSGSIKDFWTRWHITLSFWLRDFLYTRLLMTMIKRKTFKSNVTASHVALVANMLAMGLWHGETIYFITYGLYHGVLLVANDIYERRFQSFRRHRGSAWYRIGAIAVTFNLVMFSFLVFSGHLITI
jgi:membrane protein involved in D-alanine export